MPEKFVALRESAQALWLRSLEAEPFGTILSVVPRGFEAYARVFHPVERDRPRVNNSWQGIEESRVFESADVLEDALETEMVSWTTVATAFGTIMHPEAQFARLLKRDYGETTQVIAEDGWRYADSIEGNLDTDSLATLCQVLSKHTETPNAAVIAIWEGWDSPLNTGGVIHFEERLPARYRDEFVQCADGSTASHGVDVSEPLSLVTPGTTDENLNQGFDSDTASVPIPARLELHAGTGRNYLLFHAAVNDFTDFSWPEHAPWILNPSWPQSPNILWPSDRSWVMATEIDYDSTLIAGSLSLVRELIETPGLEVHQIHPDADLSSNGDRIN